MNGYVCGLVGCLVLAGAALAQDEVGQRPYEMDWAGRTVNPLPPLIDFESLEGWQIEATDGVVQFETSRQQQIWGDHVGKLTYRSTAGSPSIRLTPPAPIAIAEPFDHVALWCYGNNWGYARDASTPPVDLSALFQGSEGEVRIPLGHVSWKEWHLLYRGLTAEQREALADQRAFLGFEILRGTNTDDRVLYFDDFSVFTETLDPLTFAPRKQRNIALLPAADPGLNTGDGTLPFPTRPETILPDNQGTNSQSRLTRDGDIYRFEYTGDDGRLTYTLTPRDGSPSDITARWEGRGEAFQPLAGGGIVAVSGQAPKLTLLETTVDNDTVVCRSRWEDGAAAGEVTYRYRLWGKSLVIDVLAPGGAVSEVRFGAAVGLASPRLYTLPYLSYRSAERPAVVVAGPEENPLFLMGNVDWYLSNASELFAVNRIADGRTEYNGGTRYNPKTDGTRNPIAERFFLTVSPRFEEVLPSIANPVSPWKSITGTKLWKAYGAGNRENDKRYWQRVWRQGMREVIVTDHETGWRDGGESFTFRTRPAPGKGGDEGQYDYARFMQDTLGFVYGPYNNYTDFAPVNEFWDPDRVTRNSDGQLRAAWMRCYNPKPTVAVEFAEKLPPIIEEKFDFSTAYCDVHTVAPPWTWVDYDARVPGAGTFSQTYYAYGEIMLMQKAAWGGPVYSEGGGHVYYTGLADGNYGQDQNYGFMTKPWLVDFDLLKIHDLGCNFGMGSPSMFYGRNYDLGSAGAERDRSIDRFLAATVAFGHPGFLIIEGSTIGPRSYYLLQQIAARYTQVAANEIRYRAADGALLPTSEAVARDVVARNQIVTRYADGTTTWVNGNEQEPMAIDLAGEAIVLPPLAFAGRSGDGEIQVISGAVEGQRVDYCESPAYIYLDGRGQFTRYGKAAGVGPAVARLDSPGVYEIIPLGGGECGFDLGWPSAVAVALAEDGSELGAAEVRRSRGLLWVQPVEGAYSYRLTQAPGAPVDLTAARESVVPGERIAVAGQQQHTFEVPLDAEPGSRLWQSYEGGWIDFGVVPLVESNLSVDGNRLAATVRSNLHEPLTARVTLAGQQQDLSLVPGETHRFEVPVEPAATESLQPLTFRLDTPAGSQESTWTLRTVAEVAGLVPMPVKYQASMALRGVAETEDPATLKATSAAAAVVEAATSGGQQKQRTNERPVYRLHPPYVGGTGYVAMTFDPVALPAAPAAAFRCFVGKGDGSFVGDGILYKLAIVDAEGREAIQSELTVPDHHWYEFTADLSAFAGQTVRIKLIADPGPEDDTSGDWAMAAELRLESLDPQLTLTILPPGDRLETTAGPHGAAGLTVAELRQATAGRIHYRAVNLIGEGNHPTYGSLNGVPLGNMARAGGDGQFTFSDDVSIALNPEAIQTLAARNVFAIENPLANYYKIKDVWLELDLPGGRQVSSRLCPAIVTQPSTWPYFEGFSVPMGQPVTFELWFETR